MEVSPPLLIFFLHFVFCQRNVLAHQHREPEKNSGSFKNLSNQHGN